MFRTVFNKLHEHSHTGIKVTSNTFYQYYYIPYLDRWLSIFIHDCIECQRNKHFNMKIHTAPTQSVAEHAPSFNYRLSMDTKGPINPPSHNKSYIHVINDAFSHFDVTVPIKSNNAKTAIKTVLHHWIIKFGPPMSLSLIAVRNMLVKNWHTSVHLWELDTLLEQLIRLGQMALSKYRTEILALIYECFYMILLTIGHFHMYAYAHNSLPLSDLKISPHEIGFHTRPRIPLTFDLNLNRNASKQCISKYCYQLPEHSHYDKTDLNPFFYRTLSKPIPHWFLAVETAMLQIYSTVHEYTPKKINSTAYHTKTYHDGKPLPFSTFVLKLNFTHIHFSDKLKLLRIGPYEILDRLSDVTYELLAQDGSTLHVQ